MLTVQTHPYTDTLTGKEAHNRGSESNGCHHNIWVYAE